MAKQIETLRRLTEELPELGVRFMGGGTVEYEGSSMVGSSLYKNGRVAVQRAYMPKGDCLDVHCHAEKEWLIVYSGVLVVTIDEEQHSLSVGDSIVIEPKTAHSCSALDNTWVIGITIPASPEYPDA